MKDRVKNLSVVLFAVAVISSCGGGARSDGCFYGLIEGEYLFEKTLGTLPEGWSFSEESKFVFVKHGSEDDFNEKEELPNGEWQMNKATMTESGSQVVHRNYRMKWSNTPFDDVKGLSVSGVYSESGICHEVMYENKASIVEYSQFSFINCEILSLTEDGSKRSVSLCFTYKEEPKNDFKITFSMK